MGTMCDELVDPTREVWQIPFFLDLHHAVNTITIWSYVWQKVSCVPNGSLSVSRQFPGKDLIHFLFTVFLPVNLPQKHLGSEPNSVLHIHTPKKGRNKKACAIHIQVVLITKSWAFFLRGKQQNLGSTTIRHGDLIVKDLGSHRAVGSQYTQYIYICFLHCSLLLWKANKGKKMFKATQ